MYRILSEAISPGKINQADYQNAMLWPLKYLGLYTVKATKLRKMTTLTDKAIEVLSQKINAEDWDFDFALPLDLQTAWIAGYNLWYKGVEQMSPIAMYRRQKGLTQKSLGEIMGVTIKTVSRWETGEVSPDMDTYKKLAKIFGCKIDDFV